MTDLSAYQIPPPKDWQAFERLCRALWSEIWCDPNTLLNGRRGQRQHGVDIVGRRPGARGWSAVQCKGKDSRYGKQLTAAELHREIAEAKTFRPSLDEWLLAITTEPDANIQEIARQITNEHQAQGLFSVTVIGWDEIVNRLAKYPAVAQAHGLIGFAAAGADETTASANEQRDYLLAARAHCRQLPFLAGIFPDSLIEDLFIDLPLQVMDTAPAPHTAGLRMRISKFTEQVLDKTASPGGAPNHACFGGPGVGKTLLCLRLIALQCERVVAEMAAGGGARVLPAYVRAQDLVRNPGSLETRLRAAIQRELGPLLKSPLDQPLWADRSRQGAPRWLVAIDGIDEVSDADQRLQLMHAIRNTYLSAPETLQFFISCRDTAMAQEALGADFRIVRLEHLSFDDARKLFLKYSQRLNRGTTNRSNPPVPMGELKSMLRTPLLIAIAATTVRGEAESGTRLYDLFEDFVRTLLLKRGFTEAQSEGLRALLADLAELGEPATLNRDVIERARQLRVVAAGLPTALAKQALADRLIASGLSFVRDDSVRFVHTSFRLFFRAIQFAQLQVPSESIWQLLDPYRNGWDFTQFVLERWQAQGRDLSAVYPALLSYGDEGLRLLSRLAGCSADIPETLIIAAIAKWHIQMENHEPGLIDGPVDNIYLMSRRHPAAMRELGRIALDPWNYFEDAVEAARYLGNLGRGEAAHAALLKNLEHEHPPHQADAAEALCELGRLEEGIKYLKAFIAVWTAKDEELLALLRAVETLHRYGQTELARAALKDFADKADVDGFEVAWVMETYAEVVGESAALDFLKGWLAARPDHPGSAEITALAERDVRDPRLSDLIGGASDHHAQRRAEFQQVYQRATGRDDIARLNEMVRNGYLDESVRSQALARLEQLSEESYRQAALRVIESTSQGWFDKQRLIESLRRKGLDTEVIEAARRYIVAAMPADAKDAQLLIWAGDRAGGIRLLEHIADSPVVSIEEQTRAICALANFGSSDVGMRRFLALLAEKACTAASFEEMAKVLRGTHHHIEVQQLLWRVLGERVQPTAVRLKAASLLYSPELHKADRQKIAGFLKAVARRKSTRCEDRFEAIDQWYELDPDSAEDLCFILTTDPEASFEDGLQAAQRLERWIRSDFTTCDAYDSVVWDKKLTLTERVTGLLHIVNDVTSADDDDGDISTLLNGARRGLEKIALDRKVAAQIRFKALGMPSWNSRLYPRGVVEQADSWPSAKVIRCFLQDKTISARMKQDCVLALSQCNPVLARKYSRYLKADVQDVELALGCVQHLNAMGERDVALARARELAGNRRIRALNRFKAIQAIYGMGEQALALQLARKLRLDDAGRLRIAPWVAREMVVFLFHEQLAEEALSLCEEALASPLEDARDGLEIIRTMATAGFSAPARTALHASLRNLAANPDLGARWSSYGAALIQAKLGYSDEACETFGALARGKSVELLIRLDCCRQLAGLGPRDAALEILQRITEQRSLDVYDRICIAECCADLGMDELARKTALDVLANPKLTVYERHKITTLCGRLALEHGALTPVKEHSAEARVKRLVALQKWDRVKAELVRLLAARDCDSWRAMDLLSDLMDTPLEDFAKQEMGKMAQTLHPSDRVRLAETLQPIGESDSARQILLSLSSDATLDDGTRLRLAQGLNGVGCDELAFEQIAVVAQRQTFLNDEDREMLQLLQSHYVA